MNTKFGRKTQKNLFLEQDSLRGQDSVYQPCNFALQWKWKHPHHRVTQQPGHQVKPQHVKKPGEINGYLGFAPNT